MTDFGADESFGEAAKKIKEHYGIEVPISATRAVTQAHGEAMLREEPELRKQGARLVIAGMDGSMAPIVSIRTDEKTEKSRVTTQGIESSVGKKRAYPWHAIRGLSQGIIERRWET